LNNNFFWLFVEQFTFLSTADNFEISLQMYKKNDCLWFFWCKEFEVSE